MTASLDGEFTDFKADWSHQNSLGIQLTPLIREVNVHIVQIQITSVEMTSPSQLQIQSRVNIRGPGILFTRFNISINNSPPDGALPIWTGQTDNVSPLLMGENSFYIATTVDFEDSARLNTEGKGVPRFEKNVRFDVTAEIALKR
jgi:hypothetical protein